MKVDLDEDTSGWGDFLHIRVKLDVDQPLTRIVNVPVGTGKQWAFSCEA